MENNIYVVCWFDGTQAYAMAGTCKSNGIISPLAVQSCDVPAGAIVNGVITVNDDNRQAVSNLVRYITNLLTTRFPENYTVRGVYFVAMPRSMRSIITSGEKVLPTCRYVTEADVCECRDKAKEGVPSDLNLVSLYDNGFELDGKSSRHAIGEIAKKLRMNILSVVVGKHFLPDYKILLPKDVTLEGVLPAPVATAMAVTTQEERLEGVISVHFCDSTTLFTALRSDRVVATCVVPFGEQDVIHDLCCELCDNDNNVWDRIYSRWNFSAKAEDLDITDTYSGNTFVDEKKVERMLYSAEVRIREIVKIGTDWLRTQVRDFDAVAKKIVFSGSISEKDGFNDFALSFCDEKTEEYRLCNANAIIDDKSYHGDVNYIPMVGAMLLATQNCVVVTERQTLEQIQQQAAEAAEADRQRREKERLEREKKEKEKEKSKDVGSKAKKVIGTILGLNQEDKNL